MRWEIENYRFPDEKNCVSTRLRRINRETKSQLISDCQRIPLFYKTRNRKDENSIIHHQITAKRYLKNKIFNEDGTLSNYYGETYIVNEDMSPMYCDVPFNKLFKVVPGKSEEDLFQYQLKNTFKRFKETFKKKKKNRPHDVCLSLEDPIGIHLKEVFNVDVYIVDRMWDYEEEEHFSYSNFRNSNDYERNAILHQVTCFGGDKKIISKEDNDKNLPIIMWVFPDKIVYKESSGHSEW